ncbi:diacylglycerol kinase family protein [uncultured Oscillibacter sp.]|uniref:diacylglycerol/lipid kinase family protein n=1 Tax=uncultured Oscillibacter sp. TaxID=876091 RepID=UPI0028059740|nr:diacylglycerol kinase family protein [uncultured Oscillibacter sp.]
MKHVFLINPRAGKRDQTARLRGLADRLAAHGLKVSCLLTDRLGGAEAIARALAETGEPVRIYACGGDGTVHEAANGIAGYENAAMTVIPTGTGNDFLKNFGPDAAKFSDPENLWDGPDFPLDLIDCNGRYCLTIACSGIDARIADSVHRYGGLLSGRGSYLLSVAVNFLFKPIGRRWRVELDGEVLEDDFALVSMCNGRYYGGGSMPVPQARMDDGVLETILVKNVPKATFARLFPAYSAGDCWKFPHIARVVTARQVSITACPGEEDIVTCLDGESMRSQSVTLRLADRQVNFFGPAGCSPNATAQEARRPANV